MSKKKKESYKKILTPEIETTLPQNVLKVGDQVFRDKNIYIHQSVYKEIREFTKDKLENESGGMLMGYTLEYNSKTNIIINGFIEGKHSEGTPTTLKFTHETWDYVHKEAELNYPDEHIIGWIHTHPNFGIFLSDYDKFIHQNFFNGENQIAYVVDPIRHIEGFFYWINGQIETCPGFYIYDDVGEYIDVQNKTEDMPDKTNEKNTPAQQSNNKLALYVMFAACVLSLISIIVTNIKTSQLNQKINELSETVGIQREAIESEYFSLNQAVSILQSETNKCTIAFINDDNSILSRTTYQVGDTVKEPDAPAKPADEEYEYLFTGWNKSIEIVTQNTVYQAQYEKKAREYTATFVDINGNVLSTQTYHYGDEITVPDYSPENKDENGKHYGFKWNKEIESIKNDITYTGEFDEIFYIKFERDDGTFLDERYFFAGEPVNVDDPEPYINEGITYQFDHWDREFDVATEDTTYIAYYSKIELTETVLV